MRPRSINFVLRLCTCYFVVFTCISIGSFPTLKCLIASWSTRVLFIFILIFDMGVIASIFEAIASFFSGSEDRPQQPPPQARPPQPHRPYRPQEERPPQSYPSSTSPPKQHQQSKPHSPRPSKHQHSVCPYPQSLVGCELTRCMNSGPHSVTPILHDTY